MTAVPTEHRQLAQARPASVQTYARVAGVLLLLSLVAGGFGEFYVPSKLIVSADAAATARNIIASASMFRMGFAGYLVEAMCDIALTLILYVLLRPVHEDLALLAAFFGSLVPLFSPSPSSSILPHCSSWEALAI